MIINRVFNSFENFKHEYNKGSVGRYLSGRLTSYLKIRRRTSNKISSFFKKTIFLKEFLRRKFTSKFIINPEIINESKKYLILETDNLQDLDKLKKHCDKIVKKKKTLFKPKPDYFTSNLIDYERDDFGLNVKNIEEIRPIYNFITQKSIISTIINYLGEIPVVGNVALFYTYAHDGNFGSEKFHIDQNCTRQLHLILPINDVNEENGPFSFIEANLTQKVFDKVNYMGGRLEDDNVYKYVNRKNLIEFKSPKLKKLLLVDPYSCLHFGARARSKNRTLLIVSFTSKFEGSEEISGLYRMKNRSLLKRNNNELDNFLLNL